MALNRPCLDCGKLTPRSRCPSCESQRQRRRNAQPKRQALYDAEWRRESSALRRAQPWCSVCRRTDALTVDHPTRMVLCRRCHGELEARRRR